MSGRRGKHLALTPKKTRRGKRQGRTREETRRGGRHPARTHEKHRLERYSDWDPWQACKPTVNFKEEHGTVVIEVDCGDVGAIKVERTGGGLATDRTWSYPATCHPGSHDRRGVRGAEPGRNTPTGASRAFDRVPHPGTTGAPRRVTTASPGGLLGESALGGSARTGPN